jgi:hypothetical protein
MSRYSDTPLKEIIGKTFKSVTKGEDVIEFTTTDDKEYRMFHDQGCCESVVIEDITGDLKDLEGSPVVFAYESSSSDNPDRVTTASDLYADSNTWTFYRIGTNKGTVVIRWHGSSNGYYSESVSFMEIGDGV